MSFTILLRCIVLPAVIWTVIINGNCCHSEDWPAVGHDVRRSSISSENLQLPLAKSWKFQSAKPSAAWPPPHFVLLNRMDFDYAPQPVIADGIVCFGSTSDDSVRAVALETGLQKWKYISGGPVRIAPQFHEGYVYFGSDDGFAYCLDANTGALIWKFDGAPHQEQFLGNGRMISRWPIRTGVLVEHGVAYFFAGMWASEGVFAYALDAKTGEMIWCNDTCGYAGIDYNHLLTLENVGEMRHGVHDGDFGVYGLTPQGALAVTNDVLIVPNGYNSPAGLERKSGRLLFAEPQAGTGGHWLMAEDDAFYAIYQHRNRRILMMKKDARTGERLHLHHHGIRNVTTIPNNVPHLHHEVGETRVVMREGRAISRNAYALILAGETLIVGRDGYVVAEDRETEAELWRAKVNGKAYGLAVADGCVIATTDRGTVHCFSARGSIESETTARVSPDPQQQPDLQKDQSNLQHQLVDALQAANVDRGYALVLGDRSGKLTEMLAQQTSLHIVSYLADRREADKLRTHLMDSTSLYGVRIHVPSHRESDDFSKLPFAQYFANAVIVADQTAISGTELFRVLRPCGGSLLFVDSGMEERERVLEELSLPLQNGEATLEQSDRAVIFQRGQLPGALDWNTDQLTDQRAKWPLRPLWFGGPSSAQVTDYKNVNARPPAAYGRYFVLGEETLTAIDAYNGGLLWTRKIPKRSPDLINLQGLLHNTGEIWSRELRDAHRRSVRANDTQVLLTLGEGLFHDQSMGCVILNARTGEQIAIYAPYEPPPTILLDDEKMWPMQIDEDHTGQLTLLQSGDGLKINLNTVDPDVTSLDHWELYFDFRRPDERFGLVGKDVYRFRISPPLKAGESAKWEADTTRMHPGIKLQGTRTRKGTEVSLTLAWTDVEQLIGHQPNSFGFAAILHAHDGGSENQLQQSYLFCDLAANGINNGWANVFRTKPPTLPPRPAIIAGVYDELPKIQTTRLWPKEIDSEVSHQLRVHPLTGELGPRIFRSGTGTCGGFDFSATSVVKRSGAAKVLGIYDFEEDSGLHTFVGVSAGCNATTTTALGLMIISEAKARCVCTFPYRTTVALAPNQRRLQEDWAIFYDRNVDTQVRRAHINLGAFGDRRDDNGNLWLAFPRPVDHGQALGYPKQPGTKTEAYLPGIWPIGASANMHVPLEIETFEGGGPYRFNADRTSVHGTELPWTYTSGYKGIRRAALKLNFFPQLATKTIKASPTFDAELSNGEWPTKPSLTLPATNTDIYFAHDDDNLYVAARRPATVDRRGNTQWTGNTKEDDAEIWNDDSWELFLGDSTSTRVAHFGVSITGARYDALGARNSEDVEDIDWTPEWRSHSGANQKDAIVELAIPWATIDAAGLKRDRLAINFLVNRDANVGEAISYLGIRGRAGCANLAPLGIEVPSEVPPRQFQVRLHFAHLPDQPSPPPFSVIIQGVKQPGTISIDSDDREHPTAVVREFSNVVTKDELLVEFESTSGLGNANDAPILCAIEIREETSLEMNSNRSKDNRNPNGNTGKVD